MAQDWLRCENASAAPSVAGGRRLAAARSTRRPPARQGSPQCPRGSAPPRHRAGVPASLPALAADACWSISRCKSIRPRGGSLWRCRRQRTASAPSWANRVSTRRLLSTGERTVLSTQGETTKSTQGETLDAPPCLSRPSNALPVTPPGPIWSLPSKSANVVPIFSRPAHRPLQAHAVGACRFHRVGQTAVTEPRRFYFLWLSNRC